MMTGLAIVWLISLGVIAASQPSRHAALAADVRTAKGTPP